ncbi:ATP synthase subunit delta [Buchnera aphidicola (Sipha maydis)]|uniref:F0F1 ATP synthase subunit delta n=1 Tax=Buchnera aphidicola TaxID=9 RepID=UPI002542D151|nr:F0F1 ATP synthase subunit delta [Buchnera aphidicola]WII23687.1 F0F1 ATP synthase subunit delta [Buchnera aphidicola (Sipha maydis)]
MFLKKIAYIYAKAIFYVAVKEKRIRRWKEFLKLLSLIIQDKNMKFIISGYLEYHISYKFLKFLFKNFKLYDSEKKFLKILSENKKLSLIPEIYQAYKYKKNTYEHMIQVVLKTSHYINNLQKKNIINFLSKFFSKKISLKFFIDKSLIGGIVIIIDGFIIDYSIKYDLECLINFLKI